MKHFRFDKKYLYWGLTALAVIATALVVNQVLSQWPVVKHYIDLTFKALRPIIIGLVTAYVLNPLLKIYEKYIFSKLFRLMFKNNEKLVKRFTRFFAILFTIATAVALIAWLLLLMIPELYVNIKNIALNMEGYVENTEKTLVELGNKYPDIVNPIINYIHDVSDNLIEWAKTGLFSKVDSIITNLYSGIYTTFRVILDIIVGFIVCIYVLWSKEKYAAGARKGVYAILKRENAENFLKLVRYTDDRFGGFLVGKVVDSIIIGILSFVVFSIFDMPYTSLISVIIGVTNVIPFFGPFIGAIPCALLILLVDPFKALIFAVLILAIQQLDGNIIGPKILGDRTGMDSFAVIFAILFMGGLFGVPGMIIGVPFVATVFGIVKSVCDKRLQEKNLPVTLSAYTKLEVDHTAEDEANQE